jgi:hypothetical protein
MPTWLKWWALQAFLCTADACLTRPQAWCPTKRDEVLAIHFVMTSTK